MLSEEEWDRVYEKADAFLADFKALVRKYATKDDQELLYIMQDRTSVFSPYVWSDKTDA